MEKVIIKFEENEHGQIVFTLPDGRKASAYEIGYDMVEGGENADINQYKYSPRYSGDEYGFDLDEFDGESVVSFEGYGFNSYDEDTLKFVKKLCMHYARQISDDWRVEEFEMNAKYLELVTKESK